MRRSGQVSGPKCVKHSYARYCTLCYSAALRITLIDKQHTFLFNYVVTEVTHHSVFWLEAIQVVTFLCKLGNPATLRSAFLAL